jgi:hypothetical protein
MPALSPTMVMCLEVKVLGGFIVYRNMQKYVLTLFLNCLQTQGNVGKWKKKEGDMVRDIVHSRWCFNFTIVKLVLCIKYLVSAADSKFLQRVLF